MNTLRYYQPQDNDKLIEQYNSYTVWLNKENCKDNFPDTKILTLQKDNIEFPAFEDAISIQVKNLILAEVLSENGIMGYDSRYFSDTNDDIHVLGIFTPLYFNEVYDNIIKDIEKNREFDGTTDEILEMLSELKEKIIQYDEDVLLNLEFID